MQRKHILNIVVLLVLVGIGGMAYISYLNRNAFDTLEKLEFETDPRITAGHQPLLCVGDEYESDENANCPANFAFLSAEDSSSSHQNSTSGTVRVNGKCCKLPSDDILTDEHVYNISGECPDSFVVTGPTAFGCGDNCFVRCTRINTNRYVLGKKSQALYWKRRGSYPAAGAGGAKQIMLDNVPLGFRYANAYSISSAKKGGNAWDTDGCVGAPIGSLLVEKRHSGCGGLYFRPLLFKESGKAVRLYPECEKVEGVLDGNARCIPPGVK